MIRNNAGPRLLTVVVVLALFTRSALAKYQGLEARSIVQQLKSLESYIEELEYIEQKERDEGIQVKDTTTVEEDVIIETCDLMVVNEMKIDQLSEPEFEKTVISNLKLWNKCLRLWTNKDVIANWNFETDINEENEKILNEITLDYSKWANDLARNAKVYMDHSKYTTLNDDLQRQLRFMAYSTLPKNEDDIKELIDAQSKLQQTYSKATIDAKDGDQVIKIKLEPDLTDIMAESTDSELLLAAWWGWRNVTGPLMRDTYTTMVRQLNNGAKQNGYADYAEAWMTAQFDGTDNLEEIAEELWQEMLPLYQQLHAYVRTKLQKQYPEYNAIFQDGGIPAHLLGNMWAQNWENINMLVEPYPDVEEPDYDGEMKNQKYTVDKMFDMAEEFYESIGLFPMSSAFKEMSMKVRPEGKEVVCHASASDFLSKKPSMDFRIKMCTEINMDSFETIHHEMGHIEYFMAYQNQPAVYRDGANSAFHEAIGDTISLSVRSSKHLQTIGLSGGSDEIDEPKSERDIFRIRKLINGIRQKEHSDINFLLKRALFKIGFLPFGYMIDKWRWNVFRGKTSEENYNRDWWDLRLQYQGLVAPVQRSEADFDPGAKFHIPSNSPYICYFISFIVQFQFYESMCKESGHTGPLFECDFYQSKDAGRKLLDMMELGKSVPWPEAMEKLTGTRDINTSAIKEYFKPLHDWLIEENTRNNAKIGWENAKINWVSVL